MSATVVATLPTSRSRRVRDRAEVVVRKGCGPTGKPYAKGARRFTCGVTLRRASVDQPREVYELTVTSVWPVAVQDDVVPFAYDPIQAQVTRDVPVGEVQSTVKP